MKTLTWVVLLVSCAVGCRAPLPPEVVEAATLWVPPLVKVVREPDWSFTRAEKEKVLQLCRENRIDTLFEFIIDDEGKVVRSRLLRTDVDDVYREYLEDHAGVMEFPPDDVQGRYRAFYYPTDYRFTATFEWL